MVQCYRSHRRTLESRRSFMSRQIAVIGLGLIGGSIAMGLKEFEDFKRVGVDVSQPTY